MFALYLQTKIKFDYGYVVLENLLFEFYAGLGTIQVITWSNKTKKCIEKSMPLSNEYFITTCGEFGLVSLSE